MALDIKLPLSHPGQFVKHWVLPEGLSISEAAKRLGVSRQSLDALVNGRRGISAEMAIKLQTVFGSTAKLLIAMQAAYDLQEAEKDAARITKGLKPFRTDQVSAA